MLSQIIREVLNEAWPQKGETDKEFEGPKKASTHIMDNPYDTEEQKEKEDSEEQEEKPSISKLKKEFKEYKVYNKNLRKL